MSLRAAEKHLLYAELSKLLEAGFDIRKAAAVMMDTPLPAGQAALLHELNRRLEAGQSITSAFGNSSGSVGDLERSIIGAGERGGKLAPAFGHLADYFGLLASIRSEAVTNMIYPLVVLHFGIVIAVLTGPLMMGTADAGQIAIRLVATLLTVYVVAFLIVALASVLLKKAPVSPAIDRAISRIPWIGKARRNLAMARFCKVYHSCVLAGISITETIQLASEASHSGVIRQAGTVLVETAKSGDPLGPGFVADDVFPKPFARSYATGEAAGTLDKDLFTWSNFFKEAAASSAKTASTMLPKILYCLILAFVAWKIVGFFSSYYSNLDQLGE